MPSPQLLHIEAEIARAHRSLYRAADEASSLADFGLHDELQAIYVELERIQVSLLRGKARRVPGGRLSSVSQSQRGS